MALALAENRRTAVKATIKRASAQGQRELTSLDRRTLDEVDRLYRRAAASLETAIRGYAGTDGSLRLEVMQDLLAQVNERLAQLSGTRNNLLNSGLNEAARIGAAPFAAASVSLTRVADEALRFVRTFVAEDGLQLSDRLWRLDRAAREQVGEAIQSAIIQGHSASQATTEFLSRGEPVPADIAAKLKLSHADAVAREAGRALLQEETSARASALRVFRTEINRAHGETYQASAFETEGVIGTRFLLSPSHPRTDICDLHASVNRYGLGPGVYPQGKSPWPAHPNTLSFEVAVFADEVTAEDRAGRQDRITWIKEQPAQTQEDVLGGRRKRAALVQDILTENEIATPWNILKQRYERKGIDIDSLTIGD
jgi:hypothetical protein